MPEALASQPTRKAVGAWGWGGVSGRPECCHKGGGGASLSLRVSRMRASLTAAAMLLLLAGCGSVGGVGTPAATASSVAVKSGDLPSDMHRCDLSGDINDYLKKIQTKDPSTYSTIKSQCAASQKGGAPSADVELYP